MQERMKILELLEQGKITVEQADLLLQALVDDSGADDESGRGSQGRRDSRRAPLVDLKSLGNQINSVVSQSLSEVKKTLDQQRKNLETQFGDWSFGSPTITVTDERTLPATLRRLTLETQNGGIQVMHWERDEIRIHVRAHVKGHDLSEAQTALASALQIHQTDESAHLSVVHGGASGVTSASLDVYVPANLQTLFCRTQNGAIQAEQVDAEEIHADTSNGSILCYKVRASRLRLSSHNGAIEVQQSVDASCRSLHANTHNGSIQLVGISQGTACVGSVKTNQGRIDIDETAFEVEYDNEDRKKSARFQQIGHSGSVENETHVLLDTHNGAISIRPV